MADKTRLVQNTDVTKAAGATGKTVSAIRAYEHGSTIVMELTWSDTTVSFLKVKGMQVEVGGSNDFGSGSIILG